MNNYSKIYWLTRLDSIHGIFLAVAIITGILILAHFIIKGISSIDLDEPWFLLKKGWKGFVFILFPLNVIITCLIPTKDEAILIIAGGKALNYVQSDTSLSKVPYQTTAIISEYLDKTLKEMKEKR